MPNIVDRACAQPKRNGRPIELHVDRLTLAKRRWHGVANDGTEFCFDLARALPDGAVVMENDSAHYVIRQLPEPVLEVTLGEPTAAARMAWSLGNLHFPIQIESGTMRVADDPGIRLYFEREKITFLEANKVFSPLKAIGHSHGSGQAH